MTEIKVLNKMTAVPEETPVINVSMSNATYQGPPGYTPIKGIDYFTEDEKNEIIEAAKVGASSAADISYDNNENQIENVETVQKALDFLFDKSLDEIAVENILIDKNYQNKDQVDEAISEAIENIDIPEIDLTGYATEEYVNNAIENIEIPEVDMTGYAKAYSFNPILALPFNDEEKAKLEEIYDHYKNRNYDIMVNFDGRACSVIYIDGNRMTIYSQRSDSLFNKYDFTFNDGVLTTTKWSSSKILLDSYNVELSKLASPSDAKTNVSDGFKYIKENYATKTYVDEAVAATDLTDYYTKSEIDELLANMPAGDIPSGEEVEF